MTVRVGVISDTHGLLRDEALEALAGCELIVHAGDVGKPEILTALERIAPVRAIRGNIDHGEFADALPHDDVIEIADRVLYVLHDKNELALDPVAAGFDVVITGHTHEPRIEQERGVTYLNPGSAGPRRFKLPVTVAILLLDADTVEAEIVQLTC